MSPVLKLVIYAGQIAVCALFGYGLSLAAGASYNSQATINAVAMLALYRTIR